ncbi:MAG: NAD(P)/FAD-dependent oxidoreductase [Phycisphaerae bacterium]
MTTSETWDVVIVGAGPAGLAAGLYAARDRYKTLLVEKNGMPGGQIMLTEHIENYPGWEKVGGFELVEHMKNQVVNFGGEIRANRKVTNIEQTDEGLLSVQLDGGKETVTTRAVILSPGSDYRQLGVPGEDEMRQATRVSYCATCDGAFYRDKHVLAVGGGNTAAEDTVYLASRFCKKVTMIHRRTEFRAQAILVEELQKAAAEHDIDIKLPYVLETIVANDEGTEIDHVQIKNVDTDQVEQLQVDGVFIFVGMNPNTDWLADIVEIDENGYIKADPVSLRTSMKGVWVAGDCRTQAAMQLATACSDGVIAALDAKKYFRNPKAW